MHSNDVSVSQIASNFLPLPILLPIRLEKHLQCEKLLGLARGTTKKRGNKKSDESITPIRYNVNHMYTGSFPMFSQPICHAIFTGGVMTNPYIYLLYIHFRMWGT